jgi:hypothetical protein
MMRHSHDQQLRSLVNPFSPRSHFGCLWLQFSHKVLAAKILIILQTAKHPSAFSAKYYQQKETLVAIAKEGKAIDATSIAFIKKHALKSPSSVQYAINTLLDKQLLTYQNDGRRKRYSVSDRLLEM